MAPAHHLIDVRSPSEFATGALSNDIHPTALNVEYTLISDLPSLALSLYNTSIDKDDDITLYCRSGRRSGIALEVLRELGYSRVRNIGGLEEAREILGREQAERVEKVRVERVKKAGMDGGERKRGFGVLIERLRELEG